MREFPNVSSPNENTPHFLPTIWSQSGCYSRIIMGTANNKLLVYQCSSQGIDKIVGIKSGGRSGGSTKTLVYTLTTGSQWETFTNPNSNNPLVLEAENRGAINSWQFIPEELPSRDSGDNYITIGTFPNTNLPINLGQINDGDTICLSTNGNFDTSVSSVKVYSISNSGGGSGNVDDVYVNGESVLDTNKIAQVKTHKEVSLAEYEDANDDIIYFVDDDDDELGIYYSPIIYSTEEREVGTWTDGKPLYEKTIYIGSMTKNSSWNPIAHNINNIEKVIKLCGQTKQLSDGRMYNIPHYRPYDNTGISIGADTTYVYYMNTWLEYASDTYVTIQYTKTTDTSGSAKYNALGVPMIHYSTNEQVIGTWIDGKPLYQKTYYYDNQGGLIDGDNKIIQLDSAINVTKLNGFLVAPDNNKRWILPYSKGSSTTAIIITEDHYINLYVSNDSWASTRKVYITIEYTKTTD